jgi:hypothetical protein
MSILYRGPSIDASFLPSFGSFGQAVSEEKNIKNRQSETRVACVGHVC